MFTQWGHQSPQHHAILGVSYVALFALQGMFLADLRDQMDLYGLSQVRPLTGTASQRYVYSSVIRVVPNEEGPHEVGSCL